MMSDLSAGSTIGCHEHEGRELFRALWEQINGAESWAANPWLWIIEFRRLESPPNTEQTPGLVVAEGEKECEP